MGSWEVACSLTSLPIRVGDKVLALYHDNWEPVHTYQIFSWIKFGQFGHYDGYGGIEELDIDDDDQPTCMYRFDALVELGLFKPTDFDWKQISDEEIKPVLNMQMFLRRGIPSLTGQHVANTDELEAHRTCALATVNLCDKLMSEYPDEDEGR